MFEEFALTNTTVEQQDDLPSTIRIGNFDKKTTKVPVLLPFDLMNGLCFETNDTTGKDVLLQMQYIALSLLKQVSHPLLQLTFVDIGLNTNFPLIHSLNLPNIRFVTNRKQLKDETENLFQTARHISSKCLGYDYTELKAYNAVSNYKEPYNILFIANFPKDFHEDDINTICMLVNEGMKCGILVVMNLDKKYFPEKNTSSQNLFTNLYALSKQMVYIDCTKPKVELHNFEVKVIQDFFTKYNFKFEYYSQKELAPLINKLNKVDVEQGNLFENFLSVPIGRSGRNEVCFELGEKADVYHGLIAGASRSGKSTLLNNIITTIADKYSPDELRLYLLDYKEGVEFQIYENHPNVELLLLDNSNFIVGVDALKQFRDEINKRSKFFKELSPAISNINEYNKKAKEKIPRKLLIIDEVQQLFKNYKNSREINPLVKDIARLGGAFGIHLLFCSQSYVDSQIADDVLSQMALRISYRLANGRECRAILGSDNDVPLKLERFQMVYNNHFGDKDYNSFINTYNLEREKIIPMIEAASKKYKKSKPFEKSIIRYIDDESQKQTDNRNTEKKTTKRNQYKDSDYAEEFGF